MNRRIILLIALLLMSALAVISQERRIIVVNTIAEMQALSGVPESLDGRTILVKGIRGGYFTYELASTEDEDSGTIFDGPGSVGRYVRQNVNGIYHVDWFGAIPGDDLDDWTAIQNCTLAAVGSKSGGVFDDLAGSGGPSMIFGAGKYNISQPWLIGVSPTGDTDSKLTIRGQGYFSTVLAPTAGSTATEVEYLVEFLNGGTNSGNRSWLIEGIQFNGISGEEIKGVNALLCSYFTIRNCSFHYLDMGVEYRNWSNTIQDCLFRFCGDGLYISDLPGIGGNSTLNDLRIEGCIFASHTRSGIRTAPGLDVNFLKATNCQFDGSTPCGILFNGPMDKFTVENCYFEAQGRSGPAVALKRTKRDATAWMNSTVYGTHSVVTDASGDYWYSRAGGTSSGTDVGDDTGVTDWEVLEVEVEGAIVVINTTTNTSGAGTIENNTFFNCDLVQTIYLEETRQIDIRNNKGSGVFQNHFVTLGNSMGAPSGAAGFSIGQTITIDHSRWSLTDNEIWSKLVHFETDGSVAAMPNEMTGLTLIDRTPTIDAKKTFVLNDLTDTRVWKSDPSYRRPKGRINSRGMQEFYWDNVGGSLGVIGTFVKTLGSPFDGTYMKQFGNVVGNDGSVNIRTDIIDGNRPLQRMSFTNTNPKNESFGREGTVYFEPCSPYDDWESGTTYAVGDIVRSVYRDDEYICTTAGTAGGTDRDLGGDFGTATDTGCAWDELATSAVETTLTLKASTAYKAGEIVKSTTTGEFHTCTGDYTTPSNATDVDLPGGTGGGTWSAALTNDPTEEIVTIRMYGSSETATEPYLHNFAFCTASYDRFNAPVKSQPVESREELNLNDYQINPATHRWAYVTLSGTFDQGEPITWSGGTARIIFFDEAWDYVLVDRVTGTLPASGTTFTGSNSGATANSSGGALSSDARAIITAMDDAMELRRPLRIPAGTYDLSAWGAKTITDDLVVRCDRGAVINGPGVSTTMFQFGSGGGAGLDWTGGKITDGRRFIYVQGTNGITTPFLRLQGMEFEDMEWVMDDNEAATSPSTITDLRVVDIRCEAVEKFCEFSRQQFGNALFEHIDLQNAAPVGSTNLYGIFAGMDHANTDHGTAIIRDVTINNPQNASTNQNYGLRLSGPGWHVDNVTIRDQANGGGTATTNSEAIFLKSANARIVNCTLQDAGSGTATIYIDGLDRDVTHSFGHGGPTGNFEVGEPISWSGGTGTLRRMGSTLAEIELLTGSAPGSAVTVTGGDSAATLVTSSTSTDITSEARGHGVIVDNCEISRSDTTQAKAFQVNTSDNRISNCYISNGRAAFAVNGNRNAIVNNTMRYVGSVGSTLEKILIEGDSNRIAGNLIDRPGNSSQATLRTVSLQCEGLLATNTTIQGNTIQHPINTGAANSMFGIFMRGRVTGNGQLAYTTITGNHFIGLDQGVHVDNAKVDKLHGGNNQYINCQRAAFLVQGTNIHLGVNNFAATAAPTTTADRSDGYTIGSLWIDVTNDIHYTCVDDIENAAVWDQ